MANRSSRSRRPPSSTAPRAGPRRPTMLQWGSRIRECGRPGRLIRSTSAAWHVHGTRQARAATARTHAVAVYPGRGPPRPARDRRRRTWARSDHGRCDVVPGREHAAVLGENGVGVTGRGSRLARHRATASRADAGLLARRVPGDSGARSPAAGRPALTSASAASSNAEPVAAPNGHRRDLAGRLGDGAGRRGAAIATHAPVEHDRAQRLARVEQRGPR